ncbi:MAG: hypothetical protein ACYDCL_12100 [Myxococcales bacterium]
MEPIPARQAPGVAAWGGAMLLGAALISLPWRGHVDDLDAQLYLVVARHIAAGRGWLDLRYLPGVFDHFREHLPFGFWPAALAIRVLGEGALGPLSALFTLGTLALVGWTGNRLAGPWAGLAALLVLATCESIWRYGGRLWLDPPLVLLATASAVPALLPRPRAGSWLLAAALAAGAALVKGPFGLLPLPCAALAAAAAYRQPRRLAFGLAATVAAAAPAFAFLLLDRARGGGSWWDGYLVQQVAASATGRRTDGRSLWLYPFQVVAGRFWPGLPFAAAGAWQAFSGRAEIGERRRTAQLLTVFALALLVGLCLPHRKWWNHELLAFPALALLAGAGAGPWLERRLGGHPERIRRGTGWLLGAAALCCALSAAGFGRLLLPPPCIASHGLDRELDALPGGSSILVVAPSIDWPMVTTLGAERDLSPWPVGELPAGPSAPVGDGGVAEARAALARAGTPVPPPWIELRSARGWMLLKRP